MESNFGLHRVQESITGYLLTVRVPGWRSRPYNILSTLLTSMRTLYLDQQQLLLSIVRKAKSWFDRRTNGELPTYVAAGLFPDIFWSTRNKEAGTGMVLGPSAVVLKMIVGYHTFPNCKLSQIGSATGRNSGI